MQSRAKQLHQLAAWLCIPPLASYTTYAVPRVSLLLPTRICRIAPYLPNSVYSCS